MSETTYTRFNDRTRQTACVAAWRGQDPSPFVCSTAGDGVPAQKTAAGAVARDALVTSDAFDWAKMS